MITAMKQRNLMLYFVIFITFISVTKQLHKSSSGISGLWMEFRVFINWKECIVVPFHNQLNSFKKNWIEWNT